MLPLSFPPNSRTAGFPPCNKLRDLSAWLFVSNALLVLARHNGDSSAGQYRIPSGSSPTFQTMSLSVVSQARVVHCPRVESTRFAVSLQLVVRVEECGENWYWACS
jgi:hypothetical protein